MKILQLSCFFVLAISLYAQQGVWQELSSPTTNNLYTVSVVDSNVAWIGGFPGTILKTTDRGTTWIDVGNTTLGAITNIFGLDAEKAICSTGNYHTIIRTIDGGSTWNVVFSGSPDDFIDAIYMFDENNGFACGDPVDGFWRLLNTTDGGETWNPLPDLPQIGNEFGWANSIYVSDSAIFFGTNNTRIYHSTNRGNSWTYQNTPGNEYSLAIWFNNDLNGIMGGYPSLSITTDGGNTWNLQQTFIGNRFTRGITGKDSRWWVVCDTNIISYSTDNGVSWGTEYTAPSSGTYGAIAKSRSDDWILAVRSGGGISSYIIPKPQEIIKNEFLNLKYSLEQNYPNPFNPTTKIKYTASHLSRVQIKVYDILGNEIETLVNEEKPAGIYEITWNASGLPSGVYFYQLIATPVGGQRGSFIETKKMTLLR